MNRFDALSASRRIARTLASAPDPPREASRLLHTLERAEGWATREREVINDLGFWLAGGPPSWELRAGVDQHLARLSPSGFTSRARWTAMPRRDLS
jgi:hypothetical protein